MSSWRGSDGNQLLLVRCLPDGSSSSSGCRDSEGVVQDRSISGGGDLDLT